MSKLVVVLMVFWSAVNFQDETEAVRCYDCKQENSNCHQPFVSGGQGVTVCDGEFCLKTVSSMQGNSATHRTCASTVKSESGCEEEVHQGINVMVCVCSQDLCNDSGRTVGSPSSVLAIACLSSLTVRLVLRSSQSLAGAV